MNERLHSGSVDLGFLLEFAEAARSQLDQLFEPYAAPFIHSLDDTAVHLGGRWPGGDLEPARRAIAAAYYVAAANLEALQRALADINVKLRDMIENYQRTDEVAANALAGVVADILDTDGRS